MAGALVYSTYLGGSDNDFASGIAVDASGNAYVTGLTRSPNFPIANALQSANAGSIDAFITKLTTATAEQQLDNLIEAVETLVEANPTLTGLSAPLKAAEKSLAQGNKQAAINQITAFIHQVEASVRSGQLSETEGAKLIQAANQVIATIQAS